MTPSTISLSIDARQRRSFINVVYGSTQPLVNFDAINVEELPPNFAAALSDNDKQYQCIGLFIGSVNGAFEHPCHFAKDDDDEGRERVSEEKRKANKHKPK